tara:strand:+ start:127 stop:831 length:705 start_codon:yes stop_codon:yes gene_type:complete
MNRVIMICLLVGLIFSDTIFYLEKGDLRKIENAVIKSQNINYITYRTWDGVKNIETEKVTSIIDEYGNEVLFSSRLNTQIDEIQSNILSSNYTNSGTYLKKSGDNFMFSVVLQLLGVATIIIAADEGGDVAIIGGAFNAAALIAQVLGISNLKKSGELLVMEQSQTLLDMEEMNSDSISKVEHDWGVDIVNLKDGSVIRGEIMEQKIGEFIKIKSAGNLLVIRIDEIDLISKVQ